MSVEIDFERFEDEYKLALTDKSKPSLSTVVFEDEDKNNIILLKIKSKNEACTSCLPVKQNEIAKVSIEVIETRYGLKLIKDRG